jgi:hypothetical protein
MAYKDFRLVSDPEYYCKRFVCFVFSHVSNFFSYPTAVTITGDRAAYLDLCFELKAFSSEGS